jgi:hypothetical protein
MGFRTVVAALFVSVFSLPCFASLTFPEHPDPNLTPGSYCTRPDSYRYPEHIPYCERHVSGGRKRQIIADYNQKLGYNIGNGDRGQFKIDHLIPLCAGGSNDDNNLWPQHRSVYDITDPLEGLICEKMAAGRLLQARAIELLMRAKNHLEEAPEIQALVEAL